LSEFKIFETEEFLKRLKKLMSRDATFLRRKLDSVIYPQIKAEPFWGNNIKKLLKLCAIAELTIFTPLSIMDANRRFRRVF
jgi:hypothetical protein